MRKNKLTRWNAGDVLILIFLTAFALMILYPIYNTLLISLANQSEYISNPLMLWPKEVSLDSYKYVLGSSKIMRAFLNSVIVVIAGTVYNMLLSVSVAYALTQKFPGRKVFRMFLIFTMYFGGGIVPTYLLMKDLHLLNNMLVLILPSVANVAYIILLQRFFEEIPYELQESAKIDGCTEVGILFKIILPLSLPALATFALYYAVDHWNAWYSGMIYIKDSAKQPLQTVLRSIIQNAEATQNPSTGGNSFNQETVYANGVKMASIFITMLPIMCLYPFLQRFFVGGLTVGAVKG